MLLHYGRRVVPCNEHLYKPTCTNLEYNTANGYLSSMFRPFKTFGAIGLVLQLLQFAYAGTSNVGPKAGQIKNLVIFGDSYTDVVSI